MGRNDDFFHGVDVGETEKRLFRTRDGGAKRPAELDGDEVDYEMQFPKDPWELEICGMNQSGLERFVQGYGRDYRRLHFFNCPDIADFSPLEDLKELEMVGIRWNKKAQRLWDLSKNPKLWSLLCIDAKKLIYAPQGLQNAGALRNIKFCGSLFANHPIQSLDCFGEIPSLQTLVLYCVKLENKSTAFLDRLPALNRFDFDAGMFTTEEIARMAAQYPELLGVHMGPYASLDSFPNEVRVSGYRKPTLTLPRDQDRLDRYVEAFQKLVDQYSVSPGKN